MIDRAGLEIRYTPFGYRGFESLTFRKRKEDVSTDIFFFVSLCRNYPTFRIGRFPKTLCWVLLFAHACCVSLVFQNLDALVGMLVGRDDLEAVNGTRGKEVDERLQPQSLIL